MRRGCGNETAFSLRISLNLFGPKSLYTVGYDCKFLFEREPGAADRGGRDLGVGRVGPGPDAHRPGSLVSEPETAGLEAARLGLRRHLDIHFRADRDCRGIGLAAYHPPRPKGPDSGALWHQQHPACDLEHAVFHGEASRLGHCGTGVPVAVDRGDYLDVLEDFPASQCDSVALFGLGHHRRLSQLRQRSVKRPVLTNHVVAINGYAAPNKTPRYSTAPQKLDIHPTFGVFFMGPLGGNESKLPLSSFWKSRNAYRETLTLYSPFSGSARNGHPLQRSTGIKPLGCTMKAESKFSLTVLCNAKG